MTDYAQAGGSPALSEAMVAKVPCRPDLATLGRFAGSYGFVMNSGTSANALSIYEARRIRSEHYTGTSRVSGRTNWYYADRSGGRGGRVRLNHYVRLV